MGDSFTAEIGVSYPQTFVGLVADGLSPRGIEVLNAAVASYSPAIYFKKTEYYLETVGLRFDQMVVALDISDIEDEAIYYEIQDGKVVWTGGPEPLESKLTTTWRYFYEYTSIPRNLVHLYENYMQALFVDDPKYQRTSEEKRYGINDPRSMWTIDPSFPQTYGRTGLTRAKQHMDLLHDLLARHHVELAVVIYPWPDQIAHHDIDSLQVRFWQDWASKNSLKLINLFPDFIKDGEDPKQVIAEYYATGDVHWNVKGYQLVARRLLEELQSIIPDKESTATPRTRNCYAKG